MTMAVGGRQVCPQAVREALLGPAARYYAVRELGRRSGITEEALRRWRIEVRADWTIVYPDPTSERQIRFPNRIPDIGSQFELMNAATVRAAWSSPPAEEVACTVPDLIIPFVSDGRSAREPLFCFMDRDRVECSVDLLSSILLTLSRLEELESGETDRHGRFPAARSLAAREGFLNRPIVDEYGLALEQVLQEMLPGWTPLPRTLKVRLTYDIDQIGVFPDWRTVVEHAIRRHDLRATVGDLWAGVTGREPTCLKLVRECAQLAMTHGLDAAFYWMAARPSRRDRGYDPRHPRIRAMIDWLKAVGFEVGVHPGYQTFRCPEKLAREVETLRELSGEGPVGGRQHYLRWCPDTWRDWEDLGLAYDSTVGYAEQPGFRAGTCIPYRPWVLAEGREARLLEIPLIVMDVTLVGYLRLPLDECLARVLELVTRCRQVGGVFTLLWHNQNLIEPAYSDCFPQILSMLCDGERYDWRAALDSLNHGEGNPEPGLLIPGSESRGMPAATG
jgi:hypothetical protein